MSRKKATRRKMKAEDTYSKQSPNSSTVNQSSIASEEYLPDKEQTGQNLPDHITARQTSLKRQSTSTTTPKGEQSATASVMSSVGIKTEKSVDLKHQTSTDENKTQPVSTPTSQADITNTIKPAKIKRERLSLDSSLSSRSTHYLNTPTVDLGSQLEHSLSSLKSGPDLTWSQLLEARNLPKVHIPERVVIKTEKSDSGSDIVLCSTDDDTERDHLGLRGESTLPNTNTLSGKEKPSQNPGLSGLGLSGSGNRFSKNHDGGSGVLDLSKKVIPPEIRRVLASKYGVAKRHEEGHLGNVVPNFNKSRSRFTLSSKKVTDSEDESNDRTQTSESKYLSSTDVRQGSGEKPSHAQTSSSSFQISTTNSPVVKSKSVSPTERTPPIPVPAKLLNRRRFSSSTYEGRRSDQSLDHHGGITDKLHRQGLVDLGSHYVSLLKDSPPPLTGRNSRSPHKESANESSRILDKGPEYDWKRMHQPALFDRNAGPKMGGSRELPDAARRASFTGDSAENARSLGRDTLGNELNETSSLRATGRNSRSPAHAESHNPEATVICLGETTHLGQHRDPLHLSSRSSSRSPLGDLAESGPMIDLNSSTSQLNERVPQLRGRSPLSVSHDVPSQSRQTNSREGMTELWPDKQFHNSTLPRSASRSPIRNDRLTPPNIKEPMIELASGKQFHEYLEHARHAVSRSSSRSPVRSDRSSRDTASPGNERVIDLGEHGKESGTRYTASRSPSRSPVSSEVTNTSDKREVMIDLGSGSRTNDHQSSSVARSKANHTEAMIDLNLGKSRSPRPDSDTATEAMIDLSSTSRLHERRGTARMKPLDGMMDLNSADNPASPRSPGFGTLPFSSFPSQVFRPRTRPRYSYKSKAYHGRSQKGTSPGFGSPGFSPRLPFGPRFNYPPNQSYRMPGAAMVDLGSLSKSSEFQNATSSRSSDAPVRSKTIPKRGCSIDSQSLSEPAKRRRVAGPDQQSEAKPGGSGVKLNVSDLLQLEREEQKYIQELSSIQLQVTQIQFKMQRMQQELEKLQSSEMEIKQSIDLVRAKRVKMLKDAQDQQESRGTSGLLDDDVARTDDGDIGARRGTSGDKSARRGNEDDIGTRRRNEVDEGTRRDDESTKEGNEVEDMTYNNGSLGFHINPADDLHESVPELGRKDPHVHHAKEASFQEKRDEKKTSSEKNNNISSSGYAGSNEQSNYGNAPSRLAPRGTGHSSDPHHPRVSTSAPMSTDQSCHGKFKPTTRRPMWEGSRWGAAQEKHLTEIETFESSNGSTITLNSDGTLVLRKNCAETSHLARKGATPTIVDASRRISSNESHQFLGCLEITSTTDESSVNDDDGPKEVLAEKERECLASKLRCDQDRISSTVPSLETKQDEGSSGTAVEMDFIGHTDAVCCILPYKGKLFSASADRTVKAFDLKTGKCIKTFEEHESAVNCLQISSFGALTDRLFTGANDQSVRVYNIKSGACTHKFSFRGRVMCLHEAFGKLFVGLSSGFVAVIDLKTNECIDQFNCHEPSRISCLASATKGQRSLLCTGSFDSTITVRDQSTGLLLRHIKDHKLTVLCMHVVENILYSGSADTVVQSHNINTGELVRSYTGHTMSVSGVQALGGVLVTSSLDRIIRCFDIKTGDLLQLYGGKTDMVFSLSVIGDMIYTGCRDGRVSGIKIDLRKYHCCKWADCSLKFGMLNHLKQHVQDHINQTVDFKTCVWDECVHKFPRGKQLDVIQAATEHILSHVPSAEGEF